MNRFPTVYFFYLKQDETIGLFFWKHLDGRRTATLTCPICGQDKHKPHSWRDAPQLDYFNWEKKGEDTVFVSKSEWKQEAKRQIDMIIEGGKGVWTHGIHEEANIFMFRKDGPSDTFQIGTFMTLGEISNEVDNRIIQSTFKMKAFW